MFQKLSKVLTVLTDHMARASYDRWLKAKQVAQRRHEELNAKRRKLKEQLEQRESQQSSVSEVASERAAAASMQREVRCLLLSCSMYLSMAVCIDREVEGGEPAKDPGTDRATEAADG